MRACMVCAFFCLCRVEESLWGARWFAMVRITVGDYGDCSSMSHSVFDELLFGMIVRFMRHDREGLNMSGRNAE